MGYFFLGLGVGVVGYFLYEKYFSTVYSLGKSLLAQANGVVSKAEEHISKLV